jgi:hypothetical protein
MLTPAAAAAAAADNLHLTGANLQLVCILGGVKQGKGTRPQQQYNYALQAGSSQTGTLPSAVWLTGH